MSLKRGFELYSFLIQKQKRGRGWLVMVGQALDSFEIILELVLVPAQVLVLVLIRNLFKYG